ncbi:MAG TPA: Lrp/AsnC family transcriptional regulator [Stellaceae bacterium]|nr:Lrp/AsnC family transcriptional regulator [Stellaceae bacterium]
MGSTWEMNSVSDELEKQGSVTGGAHNVGKPREIGLGAAPVFQFDEFDCRILRSLQDAADQSMEELAGRVGLSRTPCWRRVKRLEEMGVIVRRVTLLDRERLGFHVTAFLRVRLKYHDPVTLNRFTSGIQDVKEVIECYSTAGDTDFLLHVIAPNLAEYEEVLRYRIMTLSDICTVNSVIVLKTIKYTTSVPLPGLSR